MKEKSQIEKNAEERQIELLSTALNEASNAGGHWLNAAGKGFPKFYPRGVAVSPFNGLFMALHSDRNGCKTNLFTLYSDATPQPRNTVDIHKNAVFTYCIGAAQKEIGKKCLMHHFFSLFCCLCLISVI